MDGYWHGKSQSAGNVRRRLWPHTESLKEIPAFVVTNRMNKQQVTSPKVFKNGIVRPKEATSESYAMGWTHDSNPQ